MIISVLAIILLIILFTYFYQDKLIFYPDKLSADHTFNFTQSFFEKTFKMEDGEIIHSVLFKTDSSIGLIFYLHGNAGSVADWGYVYTQFTPYNYDVLVVDYRGYGKSSGSLGSEKRLHKDLAIIYDEIRNEYLEKNIIIVGYSIGCGFAANLASDKNPAKLILKAPFTNFNDLRKIHFPWFPQFLMRYKFDSDKCLQKIKCPIYIFHGLNDNLIPPLQSEILGKIHPNRTSLILIPDQGHNGIGNNLIYLKELKKILEK